MVTVKNGSLPLGGGFVECLCAKHAVNLTPMTHDSALAVVRRFPGSLL